MSSSSLIVGCSGTTLKPDERAFFRDANPWGFILFSRNIDGPRQTLALTHAMRDAVGWDAPVLIDQEGGRVQRMGPPHWLAYPPGACYGELYKSAPEEGIEAAFLGSQLIAADLRAVGITVDCLPVLDVPVPGAHTIIGDRAYGADAQTVLTLGRAAADGLLAGGVLPVIKHIPGHGRATLDSHDALPIVEAGWDELAETDFAPFRALSDLPLAMTAHVVYQAIDPDAPATTSERVIRSVIRDHIGYDGLLMSDDLSMKALNGSLRSRTEAALQAGCDLVLHCNGSLSDMIDSAHRTIPLSGKAGKRAQTAVDCLQAPYDINFDVQTARARLKQSLAKVRNRATRSP